MFHGIMCDSPYEYVMRGEWEKADGSVNIHRTFFMRDLAYICRGLKHIYSGYDTLESVFASGNVWDGIARFRALLAQANNGDATRHISSPDAVKGRPASACKRLHMMLRWLSRCDGIVDLGIWHDVAPAKLMIPLDVHVARTGRALGLINRTQNDRKTVEELTAQLRAFSPEDPVRYDFALFGVGVAGDEFFKLL